MSTHSYEYEDTCRQCGCHSHMACHQADYGPCWWVEPATNELGPLCSHCELENQGELESGEIERPWQDKITL